MRQVWLEPKWPPSHAHLSIWSRSLELYSAKYIICSMNDSMTAAMRLHICVGAHTNYHTKMTKILSPSQQRKR